MDLLNELTSKERVIFSIACGAISLLVFVVDFLIYKTQGKESRLGIVYKASNAGFLAILWMIGATVVGFLASLSGILQLTPQSILAVGIGWPLLFVRIVKSSKAQIENVEEPGLEEEE